MFFTLKTLNMKTIKFSESELEFLQTHYELELSDAENYVGEIKNILKKLGVFEKEVAKEKPAKKSGKKPGRPKREKETAIAITPTPVAKAEKKPTPEKVVKKAVVPVNKFAPVKAEKPVVIKAAAKVVEKKTSKKPVKKSLKPAAKKDKPVVSNAPAQSDMPKSE